MIGDVSSAKGDTVHSNSFSSDDSRSSLGSTLNSLAQRIVYPLHLFSEWVMHAYTPIRLGEFGNHRFYFVEIASRISRCVIAALFLPVTVTLWAAGGLIDKIGDSLTSKSYTYWKGASVKPERDKTRTFFTLNACMMWGMLPIPFGGVSSARERTEKMAELIIAQNADFLSLQEVSFGAGVALYEKLKSHYAHFYTRIAPNPWLGMESALFVASKYPILSEPIFIPFPVSGAIKRGLFYFETTSCWVLTTHLHAGKRERGATIRKLQMEIIDKTMHELKARSNKPCVLLGDLNITRDGSTEDEYSRLHIADSFHDAFAENAQKIDATTASCTEKLSALRMGWTLPETPDELVDYVLVDKPSRDRVQVSTQLVDTYDLQRPEQALSDHKGLRSEIHFI